MEDAGKIAEKLRIKMEETEIPFSSTQPDGKFTISIGYTTYPALAKNISDLINQADKALYSAKHRGRNRVVGYGDSVE
jgi:diguanylate cyclase (GGDEF)-like protein